MLTVLSSSSSNSRLVVTCEARDSNYMETVNRTCATHSLSDHTTVCVFMES